MCSLPGAQEIEDAVAAATGEHANPGRCSHSLKMVAEVCDQAGNDACNDAGVPSQVVSECPPGN